MVINMNQNQLVLVQQKKKFSLKRISGKVVAVSAAALATVNANAAEVTLPTISIDNMIGFCGLLVTAVATVATANLLIPMTAKGIKSIRAAF
jgi:hypothetical protein